MISDRPTRIRYRVVGTDEQMPGGRHDDQDATIFENDDSLGRKILNARRPRVLRNTAAATDSWLRSGHLGGPGLDAAHIGSLPYVRRHFWTLDLYQASGWRPKPSKHPASYSARKDGRAYEGVA
jgi:hypothetical protein